MHIIDTCAPDKGLPKVAGISVCVAIHSVAEQVQGEASVLFHYSSVLLHGCFLYRKPESTL